MSTTESRGDGAGTVTELTSSQIEQGIFIALRERDLQVIPSLLRLLAVQDPSRAQSILDGINLGIAMRTKDGPAT